MKKINQNEILDNGIVIRNIKTGILSRVVSSDPSGLVFLDSLVSGSNIHRDELANNYEIVEFKDFDEDGNYAKQHKASETDCACSCCGVELSLDDEVYSDSLNDGEPLCDHCSVFNEESDMYEKYINSDVIEKMTGFKFSPHIGDLDSKIEDFNTYLKSNKLIFSANEKSVSEDTFCVWLQEGTDFNICDCCGLIEKTEDLIWDPFDVSDGDHQNFVFLRATKMSPDAVCISCIKIADSITMPSLAEVTSRISENKLLFRAGDVVLLEKSSSSEMRERICRVSHVSPNNKTYKLEEYGDYEFNEDCFFNIEDYAYTIEYADFIADSHPDKSCEVDDWATPNWEGIASIESAFDNFGHKDEFISYLKSKSLPYGRFLEPKFKIGDKFRVSFDYYKEGEATEHIISKIDVSFAEAEEIVYWSDDLVYITESALQEQENRVSSFIKCGESRIDFLNSLDYLLVGEDINGRTINFASLTLKEKAEYLQAIAEDCKENAQSIKGEEK